MKSTFAKSERRRLFLGARVRALRHQLGLTQQAMAHRVGISVSYLSQIESDDRPMTEAVFASFASAFPLDWAAIEQTDDARLLARVAEAASDPAIGAAPISGERLSRAAERYPELAIRLVEMHDLYHRTQEQLRVLNDAVDWGAAENVPPPWEEARDWFHKEGNYVDSIDREAERISAAAGPISASSIESRLLDSHGVTLSREFSLPQGTLRYFDPVRRALRVNASLPIESQTFLLAHQLMRLELKEVIDHVASSADVQSEESRMLLAIGLSNYAAGALLMPYDEVRAEARMLRHDIDRLRHRFGVSFEQVCHRLSTLQRPGSCGVPMFFCRVDLAGNITKRHSATRLQFARYGGACPMWIVHEAAAIPDRIWVQLAETPDNIRYIAIAKGLVKASASFSKPNRRYAVTLGCEVAYAPEFVYADGLQIGRPGAATPIGVSCRICSREDCEQRAFPQIGRGLSFDPDCREVVPYRLH